jgi:hypothetical protein
MFSPYLTRRYFPVVLDPSWPEKMAAKHTLGMYLEVPFIWCGEFPRFRFRWAYRPDGSRYPEYLGVHYHGCPDFIETGKCDMCEFVFTDPDHDAGDV